MTTSHLNGICVSEVFNEDCMIGMSRYPDKFFDLAIVDPPYGIGVNNNMGRRKGDKNLNYKKIEWDNHAPNKNYFEELFRVCKNQAVWGANHFISLMPFDSSCWLMWDKLFSDELTFSQFELCWTSFNGMSKKYELHPSLNGNRIHPTQKPVALYKWLLKNYAKPGDKILDTHLGSGSSRIACYDGGFDFYGWEIDADYFAAMEQRFQNHIKQLTLEL